MLPYNTNAVQSNKTIYINPNFKRLLPTPENIPSFQTTSVIPKNAHINPLFLEAHKCRNTIHMNPAFLHKFKEREPDRKIMQRIAPENLSKNNGIDRNIDISLNPLCEKSVSTETRKIICKSKNRLIREPLIKKDDQLLRPSKLSFPIQPLLLLNKRKLIRKVSTVPQSFDKLKTTSFNVSKTSITKYKLDNRFIRKKPILPPTPRIKRTSFVGRYALKRTSSSETANITANRSMSINKKLEVLNINGLLYKSTRNSLKLKDITTIRMLKSCNESTSREKLSSNANQGLTIFVRGNKYVMDANKFKLTRVTNCDHGLRSRNSSFKTSTCKRIDIGGYTYVSTNNAKNVLIRTSNHLSRAYVHNAKQKSLQTLMKRLVKTNIPCPIFQRIGKCAAFERGKCSKVHNKLQVAICCKFLRGECLKSDCLLSHYVSLSKMPVCKFFLQGVCVRNDCQYLHKKLSNTAELCTDFLRGFCQMADKCNKRHEFVCPEIERNSICTTKNCIYCNAKRRKGSQIEMKSAKVQNNKETTSTISLASNSAEFSENQTCKRYFIDSFDISMENTIVRKDHHINEDDVSNIDITKCPVGNTEMRLTTRPKLGTLPSYIPL